MTGVVYEEEPKFNVSKMWDEEIGGGIINCRNYHKKMYNNHRISDLKMGDADLLKTYKLTEYIVRNTNIIGKKKGKGYGTIGDIAAILEISEKKSREYTSRAVKASIVAKITIETGMSKITCYAFNPVYVNSCKYVPAALYNEFWEDIDKVIPEWMKDSYTRAMQDRKITNKKEEHIENVEKI